MARVAFALAALLLACAAPQVVRTAPLGVACEGLTKLEGCVECASGTGGVRCLACHKDRAPSWAADGRVTECRATVIGAAAVAASGDAKCARSDGPWCVECVKDFWFNTSFQCVTSTNANVTLRTKEICRGTSRNPNCDTCNPDGTCNLCIAALVLMPTNAAFINAAWIESRCLTVAQLNTEAKSITWSPAVLPTHCAEVDSEFKCNRCRNHPTTKAEQSLTGGTCKPAATTGSRCKAPLAFRSYCARCNTVQVGTFAPGLQCLECNGARSLLNGACQLPCRQLYGIGCRKCTAKVCVERDPTYASGRR